MSGGSASFEAALATSGIDEDAAHRLRRRGEKMGAALEARVPVADHADPGFVYEGGWLQRVPVSFLRHFMGRDLAKFIVNQWQQVTSGLDVATLNRLEYARHIAHLPRS